MVVSFNAALGTSLGTMPLLDLLSPTSYYMMLLCHGRICSTSSALCHNWICRAMPGTRCVRSIVTVSSKNLPKWVIRKSNPRRLAEKQKRYLCAMLPHYGSNLIPIELLLVLSARLIPLCDKTHIQSCILDKLCLKSKFSGIMVPGIPQAL